MAYREALRFLAVGTLGFIVDAGLTTILIFCQTDPYISRLLAIAIAIAVTLILNRLWTFSRAQQGSFRHQLIKYLCAQGLGQAINFLCYSVLIYHAEIWLQWPALAVAIGSAVAMVVTFLLSKYWVFKIQF